MLSDEQVRGVTEQVLARLLADRGLDRVDVRSGVDHDGEPALFITAIFAPGSRRIGGEAANRSLASVSSALLDHGEARFPYLTNRYPDDEKPEDAPPGRRSAA